MIPARTSILVTSLACLVSVLLISCGGKGATNSTPTAGVPVTGASGVVSAPTQAISVTPPAGSTVQPPATTGADTIVKAGCGVAPDYGESMHTIQSGGLEREYHLHVPRSYDPTQATPLVLNFHGFGSNATQQDIESGLPLKSDSAGFILATPQAATSLARWYVAGTPFESGYTDDVGFVRDLIGELSRSLCIDPKRIYATGLSNGAAMSSYLGCALNDEIAAIAPVAGSPYSDLCRDKGPMPIVIFHGTGDRVVPFDGGIPGIGAQSVPENLKSWAEHNGCDVTPKTEEVTSDVTREWYEGCDAGADTELYVVHGGGHTWPGARIPLPLLGKTAHSISATDIMWAFFQAHPKP